MRNDFIHTDLTRFLKRFTSSKKLNKLIFSQKNTHPDACMFLIFLSCFVSYSYFGFDIQWFIFN